MEILTCPNKTKLQEFVNQLNADSNIGGGTTKTLFEVRDNVTQDCGWLEFTKIDTKVGKINGQNVSALIQAFADANEDVTIFVSDISQQQLIDGGYIDVESEE